MSGKPVLPGIWRFTGVHPEWAEEDGDEDGWEPEVAWWAASTSAGLVLIDPLFTDPDPVDRLVRDAGGCAGIIRTCHWHQRSVAEAARRYEAQVWALPEPDESDQLPFDQPVSSGHQTVGGIVAHAVERDDEIALWLPDVRALVFGDAMLRRPDGSLRRCPESWTQPAGGPERLRGRLRELARLPVEHVLVSHGPFVGGDGAQALTRALETD